MTDHLSAHQRREMTGSLKRGIWPDMWYFNWNSVFNLIRQDHIWFPSFKICLIGSLTSLLLMSVSLRYFLYICRLMVYVYLIIRSLYIIENKTNRFWLYVVHKHIDGRKPKLRMFVLCFLCVFSERNTPWVLSIILKLH